MLVSGFIYLGIFYSLGCVLFRGESCFFSFVADWLLFLQLIEKDS